MKQTPAQARRRQKLHGPTVTLKSDERIEALQKEYDDLMHFANGLTFEHQQTARIQIERKAAYLKRIIDGRIVVNEKEAANLIAARSIYAGTVEQVNLCRDIQKMVDQMNQVNKKLGGELVQGDNPFFNNWIRGKFKIWQPACNAPWVISIDPEYLRSKLK